MTCSSRRRRGHVFKRSPMVEQGSPVAVKGEEVALARLVEFTADGLVQQCAQQQRADASVSDDDYSAISGTSIGEHRSDWIDLHLRMAQKPHSTPHRHAQTRHLALSSRSEPDIHDRATAPHCPGTPGCRRLGRSLVTEDPAGVPVAPRARQPRPAGAVQCHAGRRRGPGCVVHHAASLRVVARASSKATGLTMPSEESSQDPVR